MDKTTTSVVVCLVTGAVSLSFPCKAFNVLILAALYFDWGAARRRGIPGADSEDASVGVETGLSIRLIALLL